MCFPKKSSGGLGELQLPLICGSPEERKRNLAVLMWQAAHAEMCIEFQRCFVLHKELSCPGHSEATVATVRAAP